MDSILCIHGNFTIFVRDHLVCVRLCEYPKIEKRNSVCIDRHCMKIMHILNVIYQIEETLNEIHIKIRFNTFWRNAFSSSRDFFFARPGTLLQK